MDSTSSFSEVQQTFPDAELLQVGGTTCECYRVKLYGKLHFLKRLKPELRTHPQYVAAMQKEFEVGYQLEHPNLVRYAAKTDDGILMDYVDGETLSEFADHHPDFFHNRENTDRFLRQLLSVVGYLHSHQIVHLDLKPGNILITRIGHDVKLIDLGYCYADCYTDTTGRTDKYAAPEQIDGSAKPDARTDIYALGRILQTLPCAGFYDKVIRRCTETRMFLRFNSVEELQQAVNRRHNPRWLVAALALVLVGLSVFLLVRQMSKEPGSVPEETSVAPLPQPDSVATPEIETPVISFPDQIPPEAPSDTTMVAPPPPVNQPEASEPAPEVATPAPKETQEPSATIPQKEDTLTLRREFQRLIGARFKKALGHYNDSIYYQMDQQRYTEEWIDLEEDLVSLYIQVEKTFQGKASEHTISTEWCQTILYYRVTQLWKMMCNDPDHDPSYNGKVYRYYDMPCSGM